jgi:hypothetical protein
MHWNIPGILCFGRCRDFGYLEASLASYTRYKGRFFLMDSPPISIRWAFVDHAIEDPVGHRRVADLLVPPRHG